MMLAAPALNIEAVGLAKVFLTQLHIDNSELELMGGVVFGYKAGRVINPGRTNTESFLL